MNKYKLIGILLIFILIVYRWNTVSVVDTFATDEESEIILPSKINTLTGKLNTNVIELQWTPPELGMHNFKFYTIILIKDNDDPKFIFPKDSNCRLCKYILSDLEYNSNYKIFVLATNEDGPGELSNALEFTPINSKKAFVQPPKNNKITQNVNCNADGTYSLDKFCKIDNKNIVANYDDLSHMNLMHSMSKKLKEFNFDINIF